MHTVYRLIKRNIDPKDDPIKLESVMYKNYLQHNDTFDVFAYISNSRINDLDTISKNGVLIFSRENQSFTHRNNQKYDTEKFRYMGDGDFYRRERNKLYATVFLVPHKSYLTKESPFFKSKFKEGHEGRYIVKSVPLTEMRRIIKKKEMSLLGDNYGGEDEYESDEELKHWIPRLDINVVYDNAVYDTAKDNPLFRTYTKYQEDKTYDPFLYLSQFWVISDQYICIKPNLEKEGLELTINYSTCSPTYYAFCNQMKISGEQGGPFGTQTKKEFEMLKKTIMTTNIYMLIFSVCFILLHTIFSLFALKNDIQFWRNNESMEGLSALSTVSNFICDVIIALYVFDNEKTSWLIIVEMLIGVASSAWKITKAIKITFKPQFPFLKFDNAKNYVESNTKKYDEIAIKYMSIALAPCLVGYAIYSLYYHKHKSWYSYIISVAAGSVYTFGFIMMTPQLYINYKLKSVEHLPWRALVYKSLNTFVDDVASFLIDMPWLHRLSCFRDDIIFICYLYQRWAYKVDKKRVNPWSTPEELAEAKASENEATTTHLDDVDDSKALEKANVLLEQLEVMKRNLANK